MVVCVSCKKSVATIPNSVNFKCPSCGKELITRCGKCRKLAIPYKCSKCGFEGP